MAKGVKTGGRKAGTPNKVSLALKQAVIDTFNNLGGVQHMTTWAAANPSEFYRIAARLVAPGMPVNLGPFNGSVADQGQAVVNAMSNGIITPEQASTIVQVLSAQAKLVEAVELEKRLAALEERINGNQG